MASPPTSTSPRCTTHRDFGEGKMDNAFKFDKVDRTAPRPLSTASPPTWSPSSNDRSADRRKADPKFQKQDEQIKKFIERKARHSISLNEAKFKAEYVPDDPEEKAADEKAKKDKQEEEVHRARVWASDFYNDEVIRIVADYLTLGSKVLAAAPERAKIVGK